MEWLDAPAGDRLLVPVRNTAPREIVWSQFNLDFVTGQDANVVTSHLSGYVSKDGVAIFKFDPEHSVRERLGNGPFLDDRIFFGLRQD